MVQHAETSSCVELKMGANSNKDFGGADASNTAGHHRIAPGFFSGASLSSNGWQSTVAPPPYDPAGVPHIPVPSFRYPWCREYAQVLHRLFTRVEKRCKNGLSQEKALRRRWYGPHYHTARRINARLGPERLRARFYHWKRNGKTPECLALRLASKWPPVPTETVRAFVGACAVAGVKHYSQAFRLVDLKGFSYSRIFSALPDRLRQTIRETFLARRQAEIEARKLTRQLRGQMHRLIVADATRIRRLKKLAEGLV